MSLNSILEVTQAVSRLQQQFKNLCCYVRNCLGIDTTSGDTDLFLNQKGQWTKPSGGGSTDAWLKTGNAGTDPTINLVGTTDDVGLNIIGGSSSTPDVGILIDGKSDSKEGVWILGDSSSGEGILIEGISPAFDPAIHLKNSGGGIRLSGIAEGSNKILVSGDNNGNASWVSPNVAVFNFNEYISDAAADADISLPSGGLYKLTGGRTIYQKP